jgi:hypothetical protein
MFVALCSSAPTSDARTIPTKVQTRSIVSLKLTPEINMRRAIKKRSSDVVPFQEILYHSQALLFPAVPPSLLSDHICRGCHTPDKEFVDLAHHLYGRDRL